MDDLYREIIIEHYKNPQFRGELDPHDLSFEDENPLCGDHIRMDLRLNGEGKIKEAAFSGHGFRLQNRHLQNLIAFLFTARKTLVDGPVKKFLIHLQ